MRGEGGHRGRAWLPVATARVAVGYSMYIIRDRRAWGQSESVVCDLLPGPVTLVIERPQFLPSHVNPGCEWIGVRVPNSLISQTLAQQEPLCLTSANLSGASSAITANDFAELHPLLDAVVDLGPITDSHMSR